MDDSVLQFYNRLCIPTIMDLLKKTFFPNNAKENFSAKITSLNISEGQLSDFATDVLFSEFMYDIQRLADSDPAAANKFNPKEEFVWETYKGLKAVMYYRVANRLIDFDRNCLMPSRSNYFSDEIDYEGNKGLMHKKARQISEDAAKETTIEINPSAQIGKGFVIDHGIGTKVAPVDYPNFSTVIGETCIIGENCTLLNSVLLGAKVVNKANSIEDGSSGPRHPILGNDVTICAGVRVLGYTKVGDNVTIGPCCVVTEDIPDGYVVTVVNQLQYTRKKKDSHILDNDGNHIFLGNKDYEYPVIEGLTINSKGNLVLFGYKIKPCCLSVVSLDDGKESVISSLEVSIIRRTANSIIFSLFSTNKSELFRVKNFSLKIEFFDQDYPDCNFILERPFALKQYIKKMKSSK